jgi:internalin A
LDRLGDWIERRSGHSGLRVKRLGGAPRLAYSDVRAPRAWKPGGFDKVLGTFGSAPTPSPQYFVSYAWGDDTSPEGHEREVIVDQLCAAAKERGISIVRDKNKLRTGDGIVSFMRRVGAGDRVFIILSEKYLRSPYCMFELLEIWRYSRSNEAEFGRRVRTYALADAFARTPIERINLAVYWMKQYEEIEVLIKEHGGRVVGTQDFRQFRLMSDFYSHVPDILATMFDTIQPRSFEELVQCGFD